MNADERGFRIAINNTRGIRNSFEYFVFYVVMKTIRVHPRVSAVPSISIVKFLTRLGQFLEHCRRLIPFS